MCPPYSVQYYENINLDTLFDPSPCSLSSLSRFEIDIDGYWRGSEVAFLVAPIPYCTCPDDGMSSAALTNRKEEVIANPTPFLCVCACRFTNKKNFEIAW